MNQPQSFRCVSYTSELLESPFYYKTDHNTAHLHSIDPGGTQGVTSMHLHENHVFSQLEVSLSHDR